MRWFLPSGSVVGKEVVRLAQEEGLLFVIQPLEEGIHRGDVGDRFGGRVLAQAQQDQVVGQHGVKGILGVQVQLGVEAVGGRGAGLRSLREEVVDQAAVRLLAVADGLAQQGGCLQQQVLAALIRLAECVAALRCRRDVADRQVFEQQVAAPVAEQPEVDDPRDLLGRQAAVANGRGQQMVNLFVEHVILPCDLIVGGALQAAPAQYRQGPRGWKNGKKQRQG